MSSRIDMRLGVLPPWLEARGQIAPARTGGSASGLTGAVA
jgi:hypothetical protein